MNANLPTAPLWKTWLWQSQQYFNRLIIVEKLNNWLGLVVATGIVLMGLTAVYRLSMTAALALVALPIGVLVLLFCLRNRIFAITCGFLVSYNSPVISRYTGLTIPYGVITDALVIIMALGTFISIRQSGKPFASFWNPVTVLISAGIGYIFIQAMNPELMSYTGYLIGLRRTVITFLFQAVLFYEIDSLRKLTALFKVMLGTAFIACLYGCYCEWFGLPDFEYRFLVAHPREMKLYFIDGRFRIFSTLTDPSSFGILMAVSAITCLGLLLAPLRKRVKTILLVMAVFFVLCLFYSGTRTAYAIFFVSIFMLMLLNLYRKIVLPMMVLTGGMLVFILYVPIYNNLIINRVRSVFKPTKDASMNVREVNRHAIQPYIWSHPIGGGVGTSGDLGKDTQPKHPLAGFPPDSGYVMTAIETGWIGLLLRCATYLAVMIYAIRQLFLCRKSLTRAFYGVAIAIIFSISIGQLTQSSDIIIFHIMLLLVAKMRYLEQAPKPAQA
ncbi:O-antigen ligase family protein [Rhodoflexus sp.]